MEEKQVIETGIVFESIKKEPDSKTMKALGTNEGVKIGAVIVKKKKEEIQLPVVLYKRGQFERILPHWRRWASHP